MEFVALATSLTESIDTSTYGESYETGPTYKVEYEKLIGTLAYRGLS